MKGKGKDAIKTKMPTILMKNVKDLIPYIRNPKKHPDAQIDKIAMSIQQFGFNVPVLISGSDIVAGHGRILAAERLKLVNVPCIELVDLTPEQVKAFRIADNKVAESRWDVDNLNAEIKELFDADFDLSFTGFSEEEIKRFLNEEDEEETQEGLEDMEYQLLISCDDEEHQRVLLEKFEKEGYKCRAVIL